MNLILLGGSILDHGLKAVIGWFMVYSKLFLRVQEIDDCEGLFFTAVVGVLGRDLVEAHSL